MADKFISDYSDPDFQDVFKQYFAELGIHVQNWDGLFREMNGQDGNYAYVRIVDGKVIAFIQFIAIALESWFFKVPLGFIREFWVAEQYRGKGHGSALLRLTEEHFKKAGISALILTTKTVEEFYLKHGFEKHSHIAAKNGDDVFVKIIQS